MNQVFTIRPNEWQIQVGGEVLPTIWNSRGAARAGLKVEMRRRGIHELSRDYRDPSCVSAFNRAKPEHITDGSPCWCDPDLNYVDPETGVKVWVHKEPQ